MILVILSVVGGVGLAHGVTWLATLLFLKAMTRSSIADLTLRS